MTATSVTSVSSELHKLRENKNTARQQTTVWFNVLTSVEPGGGHQ